jgi:hypothetical protein
MGPRRHLCYESNPYLVRYPLPATPSSSPAYGEALALLLGVGLPAVPKASGVHIIPDTMATCLSPWADTRVAERLPSIPVCEILHWSGCPQDECSHF